MFFFPCTPTATQTVMLSSGMSCAGLSMSARKVGQCGNTSNIDTMQHPGINIFTHTCTCKILLFTLSFHWQIMGKFCPIYWFSQPPYAVQRGDFAPRLFFGLENVTGAPTDNKTRNKQVIFQIWMDHLFNLPQPFGGLRTQLWCLRNNTLVLLSLGSSAFLKTAAKVLPMQEADSHPGNMKSRHDLNCYLLERVANQSEVHALLVWTMSSQSGNPQLRLGRAAATEQSLPSSGP